MKHDPMADVFGLALCVWAGVDIRTPQQRAEDEARMYNEAAMRDARGSWWSRWRTRKAIDGLNRNA